MDIEWDNPTNADRLTNDRQAWDDKIESREEQSMTASHTVKVDPKGRLSIPAELRTLLGIEPGDTLFVETEENGQVLRFAKAENPFDALARHAELEYRAGRTRNLREIADELDTDHDVVN